VEEATLTIGPLRRPVLASLTSQAVFSLNSLVLTVIAGWQLDVPSFGMFGLMFGMFALTGAVNDALLGEARAVLDTDDAGVRGALYWGQIALIPASAATFVLVGAVGGLPGSSAVAGAVAGGLWVAEAGVRRVLTARLAFGSLILNDLTFITVALLAIGAMNTSSPINLTGMLVGWALGSLASVVVGLVQMTRRERDAGRVDRRGVSSVLGFGGWRVLQSALRPLALLAARLFVVVFHSPAVLAEIELARIIAAPITTASAGIAQLLLPRMAQHPRHARSLMRRAELGLGGATIAYGIVAVAASALFGDRMEGIETELVPIAVASWVLVTLGMSLGLPATTRLVAAGLPRLVFLVRLVDNAAGLGLVFIVVTVGPPAGALIGLGVSGLIAAFWLGRVARRVPDGSQADLPRVDQ
jgi:hypothetical protein